MLNQFIPYILSLPVVLLALSVHEVSHGYVAYKLGDPTANSFGRLSLNPLKHLDPFGFICMLLFRFGWAKPVPINSRYFKKPRRDMALTAAAGPLSNVLLSILFAALLRIQLIFVEKFFSTDINSVWALLGGLSVDLSSGFKMMAVLAYMLYMGVVLNISLAVFNLIPIPPFDGSRIFYTFLPVNLYFKVMKYEKYIMIAILLLLLFTPFLDILISGATEGLASLIMKIFGISGQNTANSNLNTILVYISTALLS